MTIAFSLVIPAYNEASRLPPYLQAAREHLDRQFAADYEVIVVDDGSTDGLPQILAAAAGEWPQLVVLRHDRNQGKGAAVRTGMLAGQAPVLLFADADGATPIVEEHRLRAAIEAGADVAIGSRRLRGAEVRSQRHWARALLGRAFATTARLSLGLTVRDTQCGFKMFRRAAARELFSRVEERGYLFDLDLLVLARRLGYRVTEVPVNWIEQPGSRLHLLRDGWKIIRGLWRLRRKQVTSRPQDGTPGDPPRPSSKSESGSTKPETNSKGQ